MNIITRIQTGSHLYGTNTETSDFDYKSVYLPTANDILLQRVKGSINHQRSKGDGEKNYAGELDEEAYSLQRYLQLLTQGQTVALEMLFAPDKMITDTSFVWNQIRSNKNKLLTKKSAAFIGYCKQQANKYGNKGNRIAAARQALEFLTNIMQNGPWAVKVSHYEKEITNLNNEFFKIIPIKQVSGLIINHWEVCGKLIPFTIQIKDAYNIVQSLVNDYGTRALKAEKNDGVDWKALSHAIRIGHQALELLSKHTLTFPLVNAEYILAIKQGKVNYKEVANEIDQLINDAEIAAEKSTLPDEADQKWVDDFIKNQYESVILKNFFPPFED